MKILGLNAYHGDSSAALLIDGLLVGALEEERLNRSKHWAGLPLMAAVVCLNGVTPDRIAISRDPRAHLLRKAVRLLSSPGAVKSGASRAANSLQLTQVVSELSAAGLCSKATPIDFVEHHHAHLASAFFCSPFEQAAVVSVDGFGDFSSVMWGVGAGNKINVKGKVHFPHSLGLFYTAFTQFLGFPKYGDEYKMMGLSAYGEPRFAADVRKIVKTEKDQVRLNLDYFLHHTGGVAMSWNNCEPLLGPVFSNKFSECFGQPRAYRSEICQNHADLAASVQLVLEENYFKLLNYIQKETNLKTLCLAGGVALNCVANGMLSEHTGFKDVYIQPAAHDAGTSIGAALHVQHQVLDHPRSFVMRHVHFGPGYTDPQVLADLDAAGCKYRKLGEDELLLRTAREISLGHIVGWFQGRMEFGPRALGNRSILADPRRADMKDTLNARIKYREPFRPFCPSVLSECVGEYFENTYPSPFMVMAYKIKSAKRDVIPAVVHRDGTGRLQTVDKEVSPLYWKLIRAFGDLTGVPILLNTSFNENEPIVNTPAQAIDCFLRTQMDVLSIGSYFLLKSENTAASANRSSFAESEALVS